MTGSAHVGGSAAQIAPLHRGFERRRELQQAVGRGARIEDLAQGAADNLG